MTSSPRYRHWVNLRWPRLIVAATLASLPALYIGFVAFILALSDRNLEQVFRILFPAPQLYCWAFASLFTLLYLNLISRFRGRVGMVECVVMGSLAAVLLAMSFFAAIELDLMGPLPYMTFFPGIVLLNLDNWLRGSSILGAILAPAGALSGLIFWHIGVAPAVPHSKVEIF